MTESNEIRIGQMSDLHLGYRQYGKFERVKDFSQAAMNAADLLIAQQPDLVVIPGDIFHQPRPYPVAVKHAIKVFKLFEKANIPVYVIRGNHDASYVWSKRQGGNSVQVFRDLELVNLLEDEVREVELPDGEHIRLWGLGYHGLGAKEKLANLISENKKLLEASSVPNVLLLHEFLDSMIPASELSEYDLSIHGFNYVAVGHYHRYWVNGANTICCTGSTEHCSTAEWESLERSVAIISLTRERRKWKPTIERIQFKVRPKVRKHLDLGTTTNAEAIRTITDTLMDLDLENTIIQIDVSGSITDTQLSIDIRSIVRTASNALHVMIVSDLETAGLPIKEGISDEEIMKEVFVERLGVTKRSSRKWVSLALDMKDILGGSYDDRAETQAIERLFDFVDAETKRLKGAKK